MRHSTGDERRRVYLDALAVDYQASAETEIRQPVGAFDVICADGAHPLQRLATKDPPRLSTDDERRRVLQDLVFSPNPNRLPPYSVIGPPTTKPTKTTQDDNSGGGNTMPQSLRPLDPDKDVAQSIRSRYGSDQEDQIDSDTLIDFVIRCMKALDPQEKALFVGKLAALLEDDGGYNNGNGTGNSDRRPSMDSRYRSPAQRSRDTADFANRFPQTTKIKIM